jgi:hypothetical protein
MFELILKENNYLRSLESSPYSCLQITLGHPMQEQGWGSPPYSFVFTLPEIELFCSSFSKFKTDENKVKFGKLPTSEHIPLFILFIPCGLEVNTRRYYCSMSSIKGLGNVPVL